MKFSILLFAATAFFSTPTEVSSTDIIAEDEVCYHGTVSVDVGVASAEVEVSACADDARTAWREFRAAMIEPFNR